jgi:hypothetical protein
MELEFSRQIFEKSSNTKFNKNLSSGSRVVAKGRAEKYGNLACSTFHLLLIWSPLRSIFFIPHQYLLQTPSVGVIRYISHAVKLDILQNPATTSLVHNTVWQTVKPRRLRWSGHTLQMWSEDKYVQFLWLHQSHKAHVVDENDVWREYHQNIAMVYFLLGIFPASEY